MILVLEFMAYQTQRESRSNGLKPTILTSLGSIESDVAESDASAFDSPLVQSVTGLRSFADGSFGVRTVYIEWGDRARTSNPSLVNTGVRVLTNLSELGPLRVSGRASGSQRVATLCPNHCNPNEP